MAEEEEEEAVAEGGGGGGGGSALKKYGPLAAIVLLAQVVLAWVLLTVTVGDKLSQDQPESDLLPQEQQQAPTEEGEEDSDALPYFYTNEMLDKITANPAGTNAQRYVVAGVQLGLIGYDGDGVLMKPQDVAIDAEMNLKVGASLGLIKSLILNALSTKYIDQIENERPEFLLELKNELNRKVFNRIPWGEDEDQKAFRVQEVIFTTMIIQ